MGLFNSIGRWAKSLRVRQDNAHFGMTPRRTRQFELVEPRQLLSSVPLFDAIQVGATFVEGDTGTDATGDTIEISFVGGGPSTQLNRIIISGDKAFSYEQFLQNPQAGALKSLDVFFDTIEGGSGDNLGKDHASAPQVTVNGAQGITSFNFSVIDGTSLLVIDFTGFDAGEKFVFTIDVDEVNDITENPLIEGLDAITSGVEFQNSTLVAEFTAPNFQNAHGVAKFRDFYDHLLAGKGLNLTPDNGNDPTTGFRDRSAGTAMTVHQTPRPITIAGTVFHDRDLDLIREPNANAALDEHGIDGVTLSLWKLNETTQQYEFTGHSTVTAGGGKYLFGANLNLTPGTFQVREGAAAGYFDVGAIPGTVQGTGIGSTGASDPKNVLTAIFIPLGNQHAVNYDFAEAKLAQISGYVYHDVDNDGNFEPLDPTKPEVGLGGIRMLIQPMDWPLPGQGTPPTPPDFGPGGGRVTGIVTTNPDGSYTFTGMRPGQYRIIQLDQHPDYSDGKETAGTVDGILVGAAINPLEPGRIDTIALGSGSTGINYNFGEIIIPVSIKGNVHLTARDGTCFDDNIVFVGVEGVKVELYDAGGTLLKTTFTDAHGDYSFNELPPGTYSIREFTPTFLRDGGQRAGEVGGTTTGAVTGTDASKGYDEITGIKLKSGQNGTKYDFCEHEPITIAGFVYHDVDNDGLKDTGENGIAGTTVQLWRKTTDANGNVTMTLINTQITGADGAYKFVEVPFSLDKDGIRNELLLREIQPGASAAAPFGWLDGKDTPGTGMYVDGVTTVNDEFRTIHAGWGDDGVNYNFGEILPVSIAGYVYHDRDNDGVREAGNEGLSGSTIEIVAVNTMLSQSNVVVVTNSDGSYLVTGLSPGEYIVRQLTQPTRTVGGFTQTFLDGKDTAGFVGIQQRGNTLANEQIRQIVLTQGEATIENNFGELLPASITGRVYISGPDGDCELPEGTTTPERPLANVKVDLYQVAGGVKTFLATTFTNQGGVYFFDNLLPGEYEVVEHTPPELLDGGEMIGSHGGVVLSDALRDSVMGDIHLTSGDTGIEYDFCEKEPASISGYVYHDRDNDGNKENGEEGISGVTMSLIDMSTGQVIGTTVTSVNGYYEFTRLRKGDYKVVEGSPGPQWRDGKDTPGQIVRLGTVITTGVGTSIEPDTLNGIPLLFGDKGTQYNFGEYLPASISGRVYISDPDGSCELPEGTSPARPLANVRVNLYRGDPIPANYIATVFTDQFGVYKFDGLDPGEYSIVEFTPANLLDGGEIIGTHGGIVLSDSQRDSVMGDIHLKSGDNGIEYDFCEKEPAKISGFVYHDRDNDGLKETGEEGIGGVTMTLVDVTTNAIVATTTTAADGSYLFDRLRKGSYKILEGNPGPLWIDGKDAAGTISRLGSTLVVGQAIEPDTIQQIDIIFADVGVNYNFGEYLPSSIQGHVFWDIVEDCELVPGTLPENPLANVTVELRNAAGQVIATTLTDVTGSYRFDGLAPGTYTVHEIQPAGFFHDGQHHGYVFNSGNYDHGPGDDDTADFVTGIQISSNQTLVHYDFCEEPSSAISGYVFQDGAAIFRPNGSGITADEIAALRDGVLTPDDIRLPGVTLELRYTFGGAPVMGSDALPDMHGSGPIRTTTDANGFYQFLGLRAGNYTVVEVHPANYIDSLDTAGVRDGVLNGIAVNRVSDISPAIFSSWSSAPTLDTIAFIGLPPGTQAVQNNFSEVRIFTIPIPPEEPEPTPPEPLIAPPPYTPPQFIPPPKLVGAIISSPTLRSPPIVGYSWHLSVVDAGHPRQLSQAGNAEIFVNASTAARINAWTGRTLNEGAWQFASHETTFGLAGGAPVVGDFNGDGVDEVGFYFEGEWFIDVNGNGTWDHDDLWAKLGDEKDRPVAGDWDGDGKDDIGIFGPLWDRDGVAIRHESGLPDPANPECDRPKNVPPKLHEATRGSRTLQRTMQGNARHDLIDHVFLYGQSGDKPVAGDWNGDGIAQIGIYRNGQWQLDTNGDGRFTPDDALVTFGEPGDKPLVGDWKGNGVDQIGVYRDGTWILDINGNRELDAADKVFQLGGEHDIPVVGDWDGDGVDEPALYRGQSPTRVARAQ